MDEQPDGTNGGGGCSSAVRSECRLADGRSSSGDDSGMPAPPMQPAIALVAAALQFSSAAATHLFSSLSLLRLDDRSKERPASLPTRLRDATKTLFEMEERRQKDDYP